MIKVRVKKEKNVIESIKCNGHAKYAEYGKDIVCASFSTMIITTINAILLIDSDAIRYTDSNNLVNMIYELQLNYDKNIDIKEENHD